MLKVAERTGLEPATSCVTGRRSNQAELPLQKGCLTITYSDMAKATRPSAQRHFTSVFGKGTGGTDAL